MFVAHRWRVRQVSQLVRSDVQSIDPFPADLFDPPLNNNGYGRVPRLL
jgi:hypothetical protein